jgi:hypothetical protein
VFAKFLFLFYCDGKKKIIMEGADFATALERGALRARLDDVHGRVMTIEREGHASRLVTFAEAEAAVCARFADRTDAVFATIRQYRADTQTRWSPPRGIVGMIVQGVAQTIAETALWLATPYPDVRSSEIAACHEALAWRQRQYTSLLRAWQMTCDATMWNDYRRRLGRRHHCVCASLRVWWSTASWTQQRPDDTVLRDQLKWVGDITAQRETIAREYEAHKKRATECYASGALQSLSARLYSSVTPSIFSGTLQTPPPSQISSSTPSAPPSFKQVPRPSCSTSASESHHYRQASSSLSLSSSSAPGDTTGGYDETRRQAEVSRQTNTLANTLLAGTALFGAAALVAHKYRGKKV